MKKILNILILSLVLTLGIKTFVFADTIGLDGWHYNWPGDAAQTADFYFSLTVPQYIYPNEPVNISANAWSGNANSSVYPMQTLIQNVSFNNSANMISASCGIGGCSVSTPGSFAGVTTTGIYPVNVQTYSWARDEHSGRGDYYNGPVSQTRNIVVVNPTAQISIPSNVVGPIDYGSSTIITLNATNLYDCKVSVTPKGSSTTDWLVPGLNTAALVSRSLSCTLPLTSKGTTNPSCPTYDYNLYSQVYSLGYNKWVTYSSAYLTVPSATSPAPSPAGVYGVDWVGPTNPTVQSFTYSGSTSYFYSFYTMLNQTVPQDPIANTQWVYTPALQYTHWMSGSYPTQSLLVDTKFDYTCYRNPGEVVAKSSVTVLVKPKPVLKNNMTNWIKATPTDVYPNAATTTISWGSTGAQSCSITRDDQTPVGVKDPITGLTSGFLSLVGPTSGSISNVKIGVNPTKFAIFCLAPDPNNPPYGIMESAPATTTVTILPSGLCTDSTALNYNQPGACTYTAPVVTTPGGSGGGTATYLGTCALSQQGSTKISANKTVTWSIGNGLVGSTIWSGDGIGIKATNGTSLDTIYTTIGTKTIYATTTDTAGKKYTCFATTTVGWTGTTGEN